MAMAEITFPYTTRCSSCHVGIKIKSPKMIGRAIDCPKCGGRFTIVSPDEDKAVSYSVSDDLLREPEPEPTEEDLEDREEKRMLERRQKKIATTKHVLSILWWLALLVACTGLLFYFVVIKEGRTTTLTDARPRLLAPEFTATNSLRSFAKREATVASIGSRPIADA